MSSGPNGPPTAGTTGSKPVGGLRGWAAETFRSLRVRNYRLYYGGQFISQAGTWMQNVAVTWVAFRLTDDGLALGLITGAQFFPILILGPWAGLIADRVDRHRFMLFTQCGLTVVALGFTVLEGMNALNIPALLLLQTAFGVLFALDNPSRRSLVVDLVDRADVPNAVALHSSMMTGSRVIGPALAGALISTVGVFWCFVVNTVSYVAVIVALLAMDTSAIRSSPQVTRAKGQLREGFRYVLETPRLRRAFLLMAVFGTFAFEYQVTLPLMAERTFGAGAGGFTTLYSVMSLGSVVGALTMARRSDVDMPFLLGGAWFLVAATTLASFAPTFRWAAVSMFFVGMAGVFLLSGSNALIQLHTDPQRRGRVLALTTVVFLGSTPIGGPIAGWVAEQWGPRAGLLIGAVTTAIVAAGISVRRWSERHLGPQAAASN